MRDDDKKIKVVPELSISADERPERRQSKGASARKNDNTVSEPQQPVVVKKSSSGLSWLLLVLLGALGGVGFWQYTELNQRLQDNQQLLQGTRDKLAEVTGEVSATGENLNQSDSSIRSELKVLDSEIRKLWDVANKRNRQWILINKDNVVKAQITADSAISDAEKANKAVAGLSKELKDTLQQLKKLGSEQVASRSELNLTIESLRTQVKELEQLLAVEKKQNAELAELINDQAKAARAMDNFRQQVNRKLSQLEASVRDLTQPPEQGLGLE